jgi:hypothetical protein
MYSYITEDLPKALFSSFKQLDSDRVSITGHSMGGHGALTLVCSLFFFFFSSSKHELTQPISVPEEPWQVQVRLRIRTHRQSQQLRLGQESLLWLLWRRSEGEVGRERCHRAHQEVEGSFGYAHRRCTCQSATWNKQQHTDTNVIGYRRQLLQARPTLARKLDQGRRRIRQRKGRQPQNAA